MLSGGWTEVAPEGSRVLEPGPPKAGNCPGAADPARLLAGEEGNGARGPAPLTREKPRLQKLDALAGGSSRSGWRRGVPPHLALLKSPLPVPGRGLPGLQKPNSRRRGDPTSRGPEPAFCRRGAGPGLLTHPPAAGIPSTLGKSVRKNTCFQKRVRLVSRYKGGKKYKVINSWQAGLGFPWGSRPAAGSRGACGTK